MVEIRTYRDDDRAQLRALVLALHEDVRPLDPDLAPGPTIIEAHLTHLLSRQAQTDGAVYVAVEAGQLVGYACVYGRVVPDEVDERPTPFTFLAEIYVTPAARASGVGAELMDRVEELARRLEASKLELRVHAGNVAAQRYYERRGFTTRWLTMTKRRP